MLDSAFVFTGKAHIQIDVMAMGSPLRPTSQVFLYVPPGGADIRRVSCLLNIALVTFYVTV